MTSHNHDGVDYGVKTGERYQYFVFWVVTRHPRSKFSDEYVLKLLKEEYPFRTDKSKWPNKVRRVFQKIPQQRSYARASLDNEHKLGIKSKAFENEILARIDKKMRRPSGIPQTEVSRDSAELPEEIDPKKVFNEGVKRRITINRYERDPRARAACLKKFGYLCTVCEKAMEDIYGDVGKNVIHVHHLKELSSLGQDYTINPAKDLRPVCPNCHTILHTQEPAMSIRKLKGILKRVGNT